MTSSTANQLVLLNPNDGAGGEGLTPRLLSQYREVLFTSLITSCGLDALVFADDAVNGHVDTLHNVAESQKNGQEPVFKKASHQEAYDKRGAYDSSKYHSDEAYRNKGKSWNEARESGHLTDAYTGEKIAKNQKYDRDHARAAVTIHNDAQFTLSGLDPVTLANQDSNLVATDRSINRSKGDKSAEDYALYNTKNREIWQAEADRIRQEIADGSADDGAHKKLHSLEQRLSVDPERVTEAEAQATKDHRKQHARAYYLSKDFLGTTAGYAAKSGVKMGAKQALGVVLMELSVSVHEEVPSMLQIWRDSPDWKTKLNPRPYFQRLVEVIKNAWARIQAKGGAIFDQAVRGFGAGVLAEIVTTIINIFSGTARSIMRLLRNFWAGITGSLDILLRNPEGLAPEAQVAAAMRVLSLAVGGMIQPIVAEAIDKLMLTHATALPGFVREVISQFAGAALGGMVSVTMVYAIDHSPVVHWVIEAVRKAGEFTTEIYERIAEVSGLAWQVVKAAPAALGEFAKSPAVNLAAFVVNPPLGVGLLVCRGISELHDRAQAHQVGLSRIEDKLESLHGSIQSGLTTLEALSRENNALLHCVLAGQERQFALLREIRDEIREGFEQSRAEIRAASYETAQMVALRALQETLAELTARYRNCAAILKDGVLPSAQDLEAIEALANKLIAQYETSYRTQASGAPARLPLLTGMAFAVSMWRDARSLMGGELAICFAQARTLAEMARIELKALSANATFWEMAQQNDWLISQYVILHRSLVGMPGAQSALAVAANDEDLAPLPLSNLVGWNDGFDAARDLLDAIGTETDADVLRLRTTEQRDAWRTLSGLPRSVMINEVPLAEVRKVLGVPDEVVLGDKAGDLLAAAPEMLNQARKALGHELG